MSKPTLQRPWDRKIEACETMRSYGFFLRYIEEGAKRSRKKVAEYFAVSEETINTLAARFDWTRRAHAYDDYIQRMQERAYEETLRQESVKAARRRSIFREKEYAVANKLMDRANEMASFPLTEVTSQELQSVDGNLVPVAVTVTPAGWRARDAVTFFETASKIMRLSLEMETSRDTLNVNLDVKDPDSRLRAARAALAKYLTGVPAAAERMVEQNPALSLEDARDSLTQAAPHWFAADWEVAPELLLEAVSVENLGTGEDSGHQDAQDAEGVLDGMANVS
jgi:hypothetical protein